MGAAGPPQFTGRQAGAKSLLLTLLGEFVREAGSVWTATVIDGLATVGITERNARQALARLGDQGLVEAEKHGRRARWHLTARGRRVLDEGAERIYSFGTSIGDWDGVWLVVICSIPESQRSTRHQFRTRLTFEGFGFLTPTIAISPHRSRESAANQILASLQLDGMAVTLLSETGTMTSDESILRSAWDLDSLAGEYRSFIAEFEGSGGDTPEQSFGSLIGMVDAWRRFPFLDPELPRSLLPAGWVGDRAQRVFDARRRQWRGPASEWFDACEQYESVS